MTTPTTDLLPGSQGGDYPLYPPPQHPALFPNAQGGGVPFPPWGWEGDRGDAGGTQRINHEQTRSDGSPPLAATPRSSETGREGEEVLFK